MQRDWDWEGFGEKLSRQIREIAVAVARDGIAETRRGEDMAGKEQETIIQELRDLVGPLSWQEAGRQVAEIAREWAEGREKEHKRAGE